MKRFILPAIVCVSMIGAVISGCQKNAKDQLSPEAMEIAGKKSNDNAEPCNPNAYVVTLESKTLVNGNWEWVWSVQNPNPGNGNNGTVQDLSHWGMQFGTCFNWGSVVGAAYSSNGHSWHDFNPSYRTDPSQDCLTSPVLKFDFGTSGGGKSYYKLILSSDYSTGQASGYYKSGGRTGCCTFSFTGIGCNTIPV
jgi:hypothetical protein